MRILVLQSVGGVSRTGETGGGTLHGLRIAQQWALDSNEVLYLTNTWDNTKASDWEPVEFVRLPSIARDRPLDGLTLFLQGSLNNLIQAGRLRRLRLRRGDADSKGVVIAVSPYLSDILGVCEISRRWAVPGVVWFHHYIRSPMWMVKSRRHFVRNLLNWTLVQVGLCIVKVVGLYPAFDNPRELIESGWIFNEPVLPNEAILPIVPDEQGKAPLSGRTIDACFVGRLARNKGIIDLVDAWAEVVEHRPQAQLVVAGPPDNSLDFRMMMQKIRRKGLTDNIQVKEFLPEGEKRELLRRAKLFVFPSYEEGWSLSVMEAVALGAIPIVYDIAAYDYLGPSLVRVKVGSVQGLASSIVRVLDRYGDEHNHLADLVGHIRGYSASNVARLQLGRLQKLRSQSRRESVAHTNHS